MSIINWDSVYLGIVICISIQLLAVGIFQLVVGSLRNKVLGVYAILIAMSSHAIVIATWTDINIYGQLLFYGPMEVMTPPLLYIYIAAIRKESNQLLKHLIFPIIYLSIFKIVIIFFPEFYSGHRTTLGVAHYLIMPFYGFWYLFKGRSEINTYLNQNLKDEPLLKIKLFYYLLNLEFLAYSLVIFMPAIISLADLTQGELYFNQIYSAVHETLKYFSILLKALLLIYIVSEIPYLKKYFANLEITKNTISIPKTDIEKRLNQLLLQNKAFKDSTLNLDAVSKEVDVNKKLLIEYFQSTEAGSFINYINMLRVKEFKRLLITNEFANYDLYSISKEAGFNSRSAFYRIFNDIEGKSPGEFRKQLLRAS